MRLSIGTKRVIELWGCHGISIIISNPIPLLLNTPYMVPIMWKFPTSTMVSKGVFSIRGMGLVLVMLLLVIHTPKTIGKDKKSYGPGIDSRQGA